jgi:hypothetical protein
MPSDLIRGWILRRILAFLNNGLGADGVIVNSPVLAMDAETLADTCEQYRAAAGTGR